MTENAKTFSVILLFTVFIFIAFHKLKYLLEAIPLNSVGKMLVHAACDFIESLKSREKTVIYAFLSSKAPLFQDGIPAPDLYLFPLLPPSAFCPRKIEAL